MQNRIQVDVWAGDLHQKHADSRVFNTWVEASEFMEQQVEAGMLCNVLHTDFKVPSERFDEMSQAVLKEFQKETPDADA